MYVFYSQGGGLGHLTRVDKIIKSLNIPIDEVIIITPSIFTKHFKDYSFIALSWNASILNWTNAILKTIKDITITSFYIDTFPFGLKGELIPIFKKFKHIDYVYISRVLKWNNYLNDIPKFKNPVFFKTILLEPLYDNHLEWISSNSRDIEQINLISNNHSEPIKLIETPYILVVHSGGREDVLKICNQVIKNELLNINITVIVFTQVNIQINHPRFKVFENIYPIDQYFKFATKIYTAAGFNLIHELKPFYNKHVSIPLDKLYDDQHFRVSPR